MIRASVATGTALIVALATAAIGVGLLVGEASRVLGQIASDLGNPPPSEIIP